VILPPDVEVRRVTADFPEKLQQLFEPSRYKILYGGRAGTKSWGIARALLIQGTQRKLRILCAREIQKSIEQSVHQLLVDQIIALGLTGFYSWTKTQIYGANGTSFTFAGLWKNVDNIKSLEGVDIVWVEEATTVSKASWDKLIPTIRKPGSEIWVSFNPELATDETYKRFVQRPPPGAILIEIGYLDNPWLSDEMRAEIDDLFANDPDDAAHIYGGKTRMTLKGAIFEKELRAAQLAGRICRVPYDRTKPVDTFWDLGRSDYTSIWFAQLVNFDFRIVDFYQNQGEALAHYLKELQAREYVYGITWMPHDAEAEVMHHEKSIAAQARAAGHTVNIVPQIGLTNGINAAREIFPRCYFDEERCSEGVSALGRYKYKVDEDTGQYSKLPQHDDASHPADAFRYLAVSIREPRKPRPKDKKRPQQHGARGWLKR
jgi:phage terminase large subunit